MIYDRYMCLVIKPLILPVYPLSYYYTQKALSLSHCSQHQNLVRQTLSIRVTLQIPSKGKCRLLWEQVQKQQWLKSICLPHNFHLFHLYIQQYHCKELPWWLHQFRFGTSPTNSYARWRYKVPPIDGAVLAHYFFKLLWAIQAAVPRHFGKKFGPIPSNLGWRYAALKSGFQIGIIHPMMEIYDSSNGLFV